MYDKFMEQIKINQFYTAINPNKKLLQGLSLPALLNLCAAMCRQVSGKRSFQDQAHMKQEYPVNNL